MQGPADILNTFTSLRPLQLESGFSTLCYPLFWILSPVLPFACTNRYPSHARSVSLLCQQRPPWLTGALADVLKMRVIQVEQEAFVNRIWALGTEASHRSHEGANAHSALVDWFWFYPPSSTPPPIHPLPPPSQPPHSLLFSLLTRRSLYFIVTFFSLFSSFLLCLYVSVFTLKPAFMLQGGWNRSITICMVARIVQQVSNESLPQTSTFHKSTLPPTKLS